MGSDQSSQSNKFAGKSTRGSLKDPQRVRSSSPGPSISSDSDIPYISYTVNRPIGDSPKLSSRRSPRATPSSSPHVSRLGSCPSSTHTIVVVREGAQPQDDLHTDPDMLRLQKIPSFQPIMRGALSVPTVHDPEVLGKLDHVPISVLCHRYQEHLRLCSEMVSTQQNALTHRIREIDFAVTTLNTMLVEKQKKLAKHAEQLAKVAEVSANLGRCQKGMEECIRTMERLNSMLPEEDRLEPFLLVTG